MTILSNTLALVVVLSVLVVVHEFGHFAVAKAFRFPVEVFSVGFSAVSPLGNWSHASTVSWKRTGSSL